MSLQTAIQQYLADRAQQKLEAFDKATEKELSKAPPDRQQEIADSRSTLRSEIESSHQPATWLDDAARRASQIQLATHAPKFTHSDARSSSVNAVETKGTVNRIGTHSIDNLRIDVTGNAAALDVANLLMLSDGKRSLWRAISDDDSSVLQPFASSDEQLTNWMDGLTAAISGKTFTSHTLAKQIYFPIDDDQYHLITPLFASSLCHEVSIHVRHARFSESSKQARSSRRNKKPYEHDVVSYPGFAEMTFGGSKPQNISLLNSQRGGVAPLLSCAPPRWQNRLTLPTSSKDAFWNMYGRRTHQRVRSLNDFLDKTTDFTNVTIRRTRASMVSGLIDDWIRLVASIRQLGSPGWSEQSLLQLSEQCLLDPFRRDQDETSAFNKAIDTREWRTRVASDFGLWLNRALTKKSRKLADPEHKQWSTELENTIARLRNDLEYL